MEIRWLPTAVRTRFAQLDHVATDSPEAAEKLDIEIERQIGTLADHPEMERPGRVEGTRELVIVRTSFIAVYRVRANHIEILRIPAWGAAMVFGLKGLSDSDPVLPASREKTTM